MKKASFFLTLIALILTVSTAAFSQTDEITQIGTIPTESSVSRMVWNDTGDMITLVSRDSVNRITVSEPAKAENYTLKGSSSGKFLS